METIVEIDILLDAIDREIGLLSEVTQRMSVDLDTQATQDMVRWLGTWEPFEALEKE